VAAGDSVTVVQVGPKLESRRGLGHVKSAFGGEKLPVEERTPRLMREVPRSKEIVGGADAPHFGRTVPVCIPGEPPSRVKGTLPCPIYAQLVGIREAPLVEQVLVVRRNQCGNGIGYAEHLRFVGPLS